jgi:hypothetical protein
VKGKKRDPGLDNLLDLDGQVLVVDPDGKFWVKFVVHKIDPTPEKPHGLDYSLTLHNEAGERLVGFDNAHPVKSGFGPGAKRKKEFDHRHRHRTTKPYEYQNSAHLLEEFWAEVDKVLKKKGVIS